VHLLQDENGNVAIQIDEPRYTGDSEGTYLLNYSASAFATDTLKAQVDPVTRLLQKIEMKADDQLDEIVVEVARSAVALLESGVVRQNFETLVSMEIDPADKGSVKDFKDAIDSAAKDKVSKFDIMLVSTTTTPTTTTPTTTTPTTTTPTPSPCRVGLCYRAPVAYRIRYGFADGRTFEREVLLPNGGPIVAIALDRAPFVEKIHDITFTNGTPSEISIKKPSEALEVAKLPLEVVGAVFRTVGELIQLRIDTTGKEAALAEKEVALIEARQKLRDAERQQTQALESARLRPEQVLMFGASGGFLRSQSLIKQNETPDGTSEADRGRSDGFGEREEP
jgi:hypothetical protein